MIIKFPTGLYKSILPTGSQTGNITYTISNNEPPRTPIRLVQLPVAEEFALAPDKIFSDDERRAQFGELIYTVAVSSRSDPGSNTKLYEIGQVLEFEENPPEDIVNATKAPNGIDIRHDTNILDLAAAGLNEEDIEILLADSQTKQTELENEYLTIQTTIKNLKTQITENQKSINETSKAIRAVRELGGISEGDLDFNEGSIGKIYQKLVNNISALEIGKQQLITDVNIKSLEAAEIYRGILKISELVR